MRAHKWVKLVPKVSDYGISIWHPINHFALSSNAGVTDVWQCNQCMSVVAARGTQKMSEARRRWNVPADCDLVLIREVMNK